MASSIRRIAHVSDVHLLAGRERTSGDAVVHLLSYARVVNPEARRKNLRRALEAARRSGADHIVVTGDLTETGSPAELEAFAEILADSEIDPDRLTLVPGNHDLYTSPDGWTRALAGPLLAYATNASGEAGKAVDRGNVVFLPLDVTRFQSFVRSGGVITPAAVEAVARRVDEIGQRALIILVQHHSPFGGRLSAWDWWDGLLGHENLMDLMVRRPHLRLLHGHEHHASHRSVGGSGVKRVFGAPAVVDDRDAHPRVRLYDVSADNELTAL